MSPQPPATPLNISVTTPPEEAQLDWYREDPLANDHHHHWHIVYPNVAVASSSPGPIVNQPRQGELFLYMHQQMLARYDTERQIAELWPAAALEDVAAPIPEGYELIGYRPRPANRTTTDAKAAGAARAGWEEANAAVENGSMDLVNAAGDVVGQAPLDENLLGCEVESSFWFADPDDPGPTRLRYLNAHGAGHVAIARASKQAPGSFEGPMYYVETAIRDPAFYRWHRRIDDLYYEHQRKQPTNDFTEFAADVSFRDEDLESTDIALCLAKDIPGAEQPGFDFGAWGEQELGLDLELDGPTTNELLTGFVRSNVTLSGPANPLIPAEWLQGVVHLTHEPFVFFTRIVNERSQPQDVTVRMFLVHHADAENRRMWIELDKFKATLKPGRNLIARPDARSSVVKRKGLRAPGAEPTPSSPGDVWCDCGWPYNLLLPSGESTPEGTQFYLMVAVTDWSKDHLGEPETCGSMSFCGARNQYPDKRRMGYPFDRDIYGYIRSTIRHEPSMTLRDLRIRCTTVRPPG